MSEYALSLTVVALCTCWCFAGYLAGWTDKQIDAQSVAKWLDQHKGDVSIIAARYYNPESGVSTGPAYRLARVNDKAYRNHIILIGVGPETEILNDTESTNETD